jgi:hypothetical protein
MKEKKIKISITVDSDIIKELSEEKINKSKLINWLLKNHYETIKNGVV